MIRRILLTVVVTVTLATGPAMAHEGHDGHGPGAWVPPALFLVSVAALSTAVYLDRTDEVGARLADAGVAVGVVGILVSFALLFF